MAPVSSGDDGNDSDYGGSESNNPSEPSLEDFMVGSSGSDSLLHHDETSSLPSSPGACRRLRQATRSRHHRQSKRQWSSSASSRHEGNAADD